MKILVINPYRSYRKYAENKISAADITQFNDREGGGAYEQGSFPLEALYISSIIRGNGYQVDFLDAHQKRLLPEDVGFSKFDIVIANTAPYGKWRCPQLMIDHTLDVIATAKRQGCKTIVYGPQATVDQETFLKISDVVIQGEPEGVIGEVLDNFSSGLIKADLNKPADLDSLPFPAYNLVEFDLYDSTSIFSKKLKGRLGVLHGSRGCPYSCSFCFKVMVSSKLKLHSPKQVFNIAKTLVRTYGCKALEFMDLNFTIDKNWTIEVCNYLKELNTNYAVMSRCDSIDFDIATALSNSGCYKIDLGIESANDSVLKINNKLYFWDTIKNAVTLCRSVKIPIIQGFQVLFLPGETRETLKNSIEKIKGLGCVLSLPVCTPYPQTEIWQEGIREGKIPPNLRSWQEMGNTAIQVAGTIGNEFKKEEVVILREKIVMDNSIMLSLNYIKFFGLFSFINKIKMSFIKKLFSKLKLSHGYSNK